MESVWFQVFMASIVVLNLRSKTQSIVSLHKKLITQREPDASDPLYKIIRASGSLREPRSYAEASAQA